MRGWLIALVIAIAACSDESPDRKLVNDVAPAVSWVASLDFAAERWLGNRVPSHFMRDTIGAGRKALDKALQSVDQSKGSAALRDAIRQHLRRADEAAVELDAAIDRDDRMAVARARLRFQQSYAALHEIEEREAPQ